MGERRAMRRRLRDQLRVREALLLDLGALVYELHRQGKRAPELLQRKAAELTVVDEEVRELQATLEGRPTPPRMAETTEFDAVAEPELEEHEGLADDELEDEELEQDLAPDEPDDEELDEGVALDEPEDAVAPEDHELGLAPDALDDELDDGLPADTTDEPALAEHEERRA